MKLPRHFVAHWESKIDPEPSFFKCRIDVPFPEAAKAKSLLLEQPWMLTFSETTVGCLQSSEDGEKREDVPLRSRLTVVGKADDVHHLRVLCRDFLLSVGIDALLVS